MKLGISTSKLGRRFSTLRQATDIASLQLLEQRRLLSAAALGPIPSGTEGSNPSNFYAVGGTTLFFADDAAGTQHLYQTDGTNVALVNNTVSNAASGGSDAIVSGSNLFFIGNSQDGEQIYEASVNSSNAATVTAFTDITPDNNLNRYSITGAAAVGSNVYFVVGLGGTTPDSLYVSNGTTAGTVNLGTFASVPEIANLNGTAIFSADDGKGAGEQLWVSNGTVSGTLPLDDKNSHVVPSPEDFVQLGNDLVFSSSSTGDLYETDGTKTGTMAVVSDGSVNVDGTAQDNTDERLTVLSGDVYYNGNSSLYKWDATNGATRVSTAVSSPSYITAMGGDVYFSGSNSADGQELWKSDGTSAGTTLVKDIDTGSSSSNPSDLTASGTELFFEASPNGGAEQIFASDGTTAGTTQLTNNLSGSGGFDNISPGGNQVAYVSYDDGFHGAEPWKLTSTGMTLLADVNTVPTDDSQAPQDVTTVGNEVYFVSGNNDEFGESSVGNGGNDTLWKTDGTPAGTVNITPAGTLTTGSGSSATTVTIPLSTGESFSDLQGGTSVLYFESNADGTSGALWIYNGTTASHIQITPSGSTTAIDVVPSNDNMTTIGDELYFDYNDGTHGVELWKTDGTTTSMVSDIDTVATGTGNDTASSTPSGFNVLGSKLLFIADSGNGAGPELWISDGTAAGTMAIKHIPGLPSGNPVEVDDVNNGSGYLAIDASGSSTLWKTDGTAAGTILLGTFSEVDFNDGSSSAPPVIGNDFFFVADNIEGDGLSLWKTDGTAAGTVLVKSESVNSGSSNADGGLNPTDLVTLNSSTIVFAGTSASGTELWKTDGTTAGTAQVADIYPGEASSNPENLVVLNGEVYFSAVSGDTVAAHNGDRELWKSDGTAAGTSQVAQILPTTEPGQRTYNSSTYSYGYTGANVSNLTVSGSKILFTADDGTHGQELWQTDGTTAGTFLVQDINPNGSSSPEDLTPLTVGGTSGYQTVVFFADDGASGDQPYSVSTQPLLVLSATSLNVNEGGSNTFNVHLAYAPSEPITVTIGITGGDPIISASPTTLTFTPANYQTDQTVMLTSGDDADTQDQTATFTLSTPGFQDQTVIATQLDKDGPYIPTGDFKLSPTSGTSKKVIKFSVGHATPGGSGSAVKTASFYEDSNGDGVYEAGVDELLKTVKLSRSGAASYSLKASTLTSTTTTFFAVITDAAGGTTGQPPSATFTLIASPTRSSRSAIKQAAVVSSSSDNSDPQSSSITQSMFSQTPILG